MKRLPIVVFVLLFASTSLAGPGAGRLPLQVTLDDVLELANERSRRVAAERAKLKISKAEWVRAGLLPNPALRYGGVHLYQGQSTGAISAHQMALELPVLLFGQRGTRLDAAQASLLADRARIEMALAEHRALVRKTFYNLLARQEHLEILKGSLAEVDRVKRIVAGRAAAGDRSRYDLARIEVEDETTRVEVMNAEVEVGEAASALAMVVGVAGWSPRASGTLQPAAMRLDFDAVWSMTLRRRPGLEAARRAEFAAQRGIKMAFRERWPIPAFELGTQITRDANGMSALWGISLPLPLFDRNQGSIARAEAELRIAELTREAELSEARTEVARACATLAARRAALSHLESGAYQRIPTLRRMAEDAYREARGGILELLDSLRSLKEVRLTYLRQAELVKQAEVDLILAAGLDVRDEASSGE